MSRRTYHPAIAEHIGVCVREVRHERGISQGELAHLVGVSDSQVSRWEQGIHSPSIESLLLLSVELGVEPSRLLPEKSEAQEMIYG